MDALWPVIEPVLADHYWLRDRMKCECGLTFDLLSAWRIHVAREVEYAVRSHGWRASP